MDTVLILLIILVCTFVLGFGIVLIRKDIEELKNKYKNINYDCKRESNKKIK